MKSWVFWVLWTIGISIGATWLYCIDAKDNIPTFALAGVAIVFSYFAFQFSLERFRLDLLDKRWEIYSSTLEFCSAIIREDGIPKKSDDEYRNRQVVDLLEAAHNSFRGVGHHRVRALFGEDIQLEFDKLNEAYAVFKSYAGKPDQIEAEYQKLIYVTDLARDLPELFKPYIYFGDYRKK